MCVCVSQRDVLIHSMALNSKYAGSVYDCIVRSFLFTFTLKDCERRRGEAGVRGRGREEM